MRTLYSIRECPTEAVADDLDSVMAEIQRVVALVTGGASGLGKGTVARLARQVSGSLY